MRLKPGQGDWNRDSDGRARGEKQEQCWQGMRRESGTVVAGTRETGTVVEGQRETRIVVEGQRETGTVVEGQRETGIVV